MQRKTSVERIRKSREHAKARQPVAEAGASGPWARPSPRSVKALIKRERDVLTTRASLARPVFFMAPPRSRVILHGTCAGGAKYVARAGRTFARSSKPAPGEQRCPCVDSKNIGLSVSVYISLKSKDFVKFRLCFLSVSELPRWSSRRGTQ